jgi:gelsolin
LNQGDTFILYANPSLVWIWHGESSNPDEKAKANEAGEQMCTEGTVKIIEASDPEEDNPEFWAYLGDGEIQPAEDGDKDVKAFVPILYRIAGDGTTTKVAEGEPVKIRWGHPVVKLDRSVLDDSDVFLLDAGFEVFLWMGKVSDKEEKLAGMEMGDKYMKSTPRCANLPLTIMKSGWESPNFNAFFD